MGKRNMAVGFHGNKLALLQTKPVMHQLSQSYPDIDAKDALIDTSVKPLFELPLSVWQHSAPRGIVASIEANRILQAAANSSPAGPEKIGKLLADKLLTEGAQELISEKGR